MTIDFSNMDELHYLLFSEEWRLKKHTQEMQDILSKLLKKSYLISSDDGLILTKDPNGYEYAVLSTDKNQYKLNETRLFQFEEILDFLCQNSFGLLLDIKNSKPTHILTAGDILCYKLYERFKIEGGGKVLDLQNTSGKIYIGEPHPDYVPTYSIEKIKQFMKGKWQIENPDIKLIMDSENEELYLYFMISEQLHNNGQNLKFLESVKWFLPGHYSLIAYSKNLS